MWPGVFQAGFGGWIWPDLCHAPPCSLILARSPFYAGFLRFLGLGPRMVLTALLPGSRIRIACPISSRATLGFGVAPVAHSGIGSHTRPYQGGSNDWLTPPWLVYALQADFGHFDLDPCASARQPWRTATTQWTRDGLDRHWWGRVWLNPPYGPAVGEWLSKLADHGDGVALVFARTETAWFFSQVWERAHSVLFLKGRLHFHRPDGSPSVSNSGGPSVLVAYGMENSRILSQSSIPGQWLSREISP